MMVKSFTLGDFTIWEKSGAVFLLYALYFIQPLRFAWVFSIKSDINRIQKDSFLKYFLKLVFYICRKS